MLKEITAPKLSKKCWINGGWCMTFVYSNKGNFIVKGFSGDVDIVLDELKSKGYRFFYNRVIFCNNTKRSYWSFSIGNTYIRHPNYKKGKNHFYVRNYKFINGDYVKIEYKFKRLPNKWISEFDEF